MTPPPSSLLWPLLLRPTSRLQSFPSSTSFPVASSVANRQYLWTISLPQDANIQQRGPQWTLCAIEHQKSRLIRPFERQTKKLGKRFSTTSAKHASQKVKQLGRRPFCHIFTFFLPLKYQAPVPPLKQEKEPTLRCVAVLNSSLAITITTSIPFTFSESC